MLVRGVYSARRENGRGAREKGGQRRAMLTSQWEEGAVVTRVVVMRGRSD